MENSQGESTFETHTDCAVRVGEEEKRKRVRMCCMLYPTMYVCMMSVPAASGKNKEGGGLIKKKKRVGSRTASTFLLSLWNMDLRISLSPSCLIRGEGLIIRANLLQPPSPDDPATDFTSFLSNPWLV